MTIVDTVGSNSPIYANDQDDFNMKFQEKDSTEKYINDILFDISDY